MLIQPYQSMDSTKETARNNQAKDTVSFATINLHKANTSFQTAGVTPQSKSAKLNLPTSASSAHKVSKFSITPVFQLMLNPLKAKKYKWAWSNQILPLKLH